MSYAIETKKRKFHRVLESLSKPLSGDTFTRAPKKREQPAQDLSIKKARLSTSDSLDPSSTRKSSLLKVSRPSSRASSVSSTSRPSFVPWDRERFLERLETFRRVDRWSSKPAEINEVQWSKRGWICTDTSRVTCVGGCGGSVVIKLPDDIDELDGYDDEKVQERREVRTYYLQFNLLLDDPGIDQVTGSRLVEEYSRLLVEGHGENCAWRNKGCDATIHRLPLTNPDVAFANLQKRYANLVTMGTQLPEYNTIQTPEGFDLEEMASILPAEYFLRQNDFPREPGPQGEHSEEDLQNARPQKEDSQDESPQEKGNDEPNTASNESTQENNQTQPDDQQPQSKEQQHPDSESEREPAQSPDDKAHTNNNNSNNEKSPQPSSTNPPTPKPKPNDNLNRSALALAFFGWDTISPDGATGLVGCKACFRRLGLWLYKPKENGDLTVYGNLDVSNEHMEYCPWVNGEAQSGGGSGSTTDTNNKPTKKKKEEEGPENLHRSGWQLLSQAVKVIHRRQIRKSTTTAGTSVDQFSGGLSGHDQVGSPSPNPDLNLDHEPVIVDDETKKVADREWWGKIRRMKQMLNVKARS